MIDIPRDLPPLGHVGYIMEDIDRGVDGFRRALGVGNFRVYDYVPLRAWAYGRSLSPCRLRIGIGSVGGHVKIELIQPGEGATPQASFLQEKGPGLHHVAFSSERYEEWPDRFRQLGAEVAGMPGIVEISEIARNRGGERT